MTCRICLDEGDLISPCLCTGTAAYVHEECLLKWLNTSGRTDCEICKYEYQYEEVEEIKCKPCPYWYCGGRSSVSLFTVFIISIPCVSFSGQYSPEYTFFICNALLWLTLLFYKDDDHLMEKSVLWKIGLCMGQFIVAYDYNYWFYFEIDMAMLVIHALFVYLQLVSNQSKQVVQYIYTREDS